MSKIENTEQIIPGDKANTKDKDNGRNKSKSSSPLHQHQQQQEHQQQTQHRQPTVLVKSASQGSPLAGLQQSSTPEHMRGATKDMFDLIERAQCSRLDDQRCVLPTYFSQTLKTKVSPTKASVTTRFDELGKARLAVVQLQKEDAEAELRYKQIEHEQDTEELLTLMEEAVS